MSYHCAVRKWTETRVDELVFIGWVVKFDFYPGHYALTKVTNSCLEQEVNPEDLDAGPFDTFEEARAVLLAIHALQGTNT